VKKVTAPIPFAGSELGECRHVCAFFNSDDEEYRVLLPFIKDGFGSGDKAIHVVNPGQHSDHLKRLAAVGIDPKQPNRRGSSSSEPIPRHTSATDVSIRIECGGVRAVGQRHRQGRLHAKPYCLPHGLGG
jgi:hypothetical protein